MVTIMRGCDNFCSFCVVPYVRGRETSREPGAIIDEVAAFVAAGGLEVTLLGQNVNSYGRGLPEPMTFPQLLERLNALPGLKRLRFATSHPRDLSPELIQRLRGAARPVRTSPPAGAVRRQPGPDEDEPRLHPGSTTWKRSRRSSAPARASPCPPI